MNLPDFELPNFSTVWHLALVYFAIGCVLGFVEFTIAKGVFRNHPRRADMMKPGALRTWILVNAVAWPGILVWLALLGAIKGVMFYVENKKRK